MTPDADTTLTVETIECVYLAVLESRTAEGDFWASVMAKFKIQKVYFSRYLPQDAAYRVDPVDWLGEPTILLLPEAWRRHLPPLPRLLTGEEP